MNLENQIFLFSQKLSPKYIYDGIGNLLTVEDPSGTITYTYNYDGLLTGVTNANGETISYAYNSGYQLRKISVGGMPFAKRFTTPLLITVTCTVLRYR